MSEREREREREIIISGENKQKYNHTRIVIPYCSMNQISHTLLEQLS